MNTLYIRFSSILEQLLKDREYGIEPSPSNTDPLFLLLTLKPNLVGFAVLDGQPEEDFSKAFQNFKNLYSVHSTEWADFDLTLVLCRTDIEKTTDEFCSEKEMDPYFCRKLVIDMNKDLKVELGQLPFVPLRPESIIGLKRPISAQTFLTKHGVTSALARYLVVPHVRGIERIVEECVEGILGESKWLEAEIEEFPLPQHEVSPKVRLKGLEISNFRCYCGNYKFDLDADLVILFGPNGFGKTSFFDAIDFVCTGGVARFDERFKRKTYRLLNALKHLDSSRDDSFVKATTLIDDTKVPLERRMSNRTQAYVKSISKNRTKTLMELTGISEKPPDLRIGNLVRLFRATHLFGQEYQSLTSELIEHSRLPEDTVSRMLAFQDYVEAINKAKKVSGELKRQIREKESGITFLTNSLKSKKAEMEQFVQLAKIVEKPETVSAIGKEIAEKIIREINIPIEIPKELNQEIVHEWRAMIAGQAGSITQNLRVIGKLEAEFPGFLMHKKKLKEKLLELIQKKKLLGESNKYYSEKKKKLEESSKKFEKMFLEERNFSGKKENLNWLLQSKVDYEQLKKQIAKEDKDYRNIQVKLLKLLPKVEKLKSESKIAEQTIGKITAEIKILENIPKELSDFEKSVDDWMKETSRQKELKIYLQRMEQEIVSVKSELRIKKGGLNVAIITQNKLRRHIGNLQQSQSELQTLLDNIERHILSDICPVCGARHKSREELIERLKFQRGIQPNQIQKALESFENVRVKSDKLKKQVNDLEIKVKQSEQKFEETQKVLLDIKRKIKTYKERAISLDVPIDSEDLMVAIDSKRKKILEQKNVKQQELSKEKSKVKKQREEFAIFVKHQEGLEQNLRTTESRRNQLQSMIDKISRDALAHQVSLALEKEIIQRELSTTNSILEEFPKQIEMQQTENQNLQKEVGNLFENKSILESQIQELDKEILDSKRYIEEVERLIKRLNLNLEVDMNQVLILKKGFMEKLSSLDLLLNEITNFEITLDAMQVSTTVARIQQDTENIKKQHQDIEKRRDRLSAWLRYFDVIRKELELLQNQALKEYTEKYGPLSSTVQRRLRSIYGFGDIGLNPEKGGIAVRVERKGEENIVPSDYFSKSQIQIVMLSFFLSATLTQTWSSFAPILLDDPVGHFDDLNAYSFVDLIRTLIMEPGREHQFIVSTCEDRLFRLMRQKFSKINRRVIFYVFESIGENGPKIKRL